MGSKRKSYKTRRFCTPEERFRKGQRLKECYEEKGIAQNELERRLYISKGNLAHIVNGDRNLTPEIAMKAAEILGVDYRYLTLETDIKYEKDRIDYEYRKEQEKASEKEFRNDLRLKIKGLLEVCGLVLLDGDTEEDNVLEKRYFIGNSLHSRYYVTATNDMDDAIDRIIEHTKAEMTFILNRKARPATQEEAMNSNLKEEFPQTEWKIDL